MLSLAEPALTGDFDNLNVVMGAIIADVVSCTPAVVERVGVAIPKGFPSQIAGTIIDGLRANGGAERRTIESPTPP